MRKQKEMLLLVSIIIGCLSSCHPDRAVQNITESSEVAREAVETATGVTKVISDTAGEIADDMTRLKGMAESIHSFAGEKNPESPDDETDKPDAIEKQPAPSGKTGVEPSFAGEAYIVINDNMPFFTEDDFTTEPFEDYSPLDPLGRCGVAYANICKELMPDEKRGKIGMVKPSGWHTAKYPGCVEGNYLYNRCHLIGYQLAGENANEKNLITGTRYLNVIGMLPFENEVADYIHDNPGNHVLYRVTPVYEGDNLVASGLYMEALSVEDRGAGVCFNVYCYNAQPGIIIDYATGESELDPDFDGEYVTESVFSADD